MDMREPETRMGEWGEVEVIDARVRQTGTPPPPPLPPLCRMHGDWYIGPKCPRCGSDWPRKGLWGWFGPRECVNRRCRERGSTV